MGGGVRIRSFGEFEWWSNDTALPVPSHRSTRELLLFLSGRSAFHRELALTTLWPDRSRQRAGKALSQALWEIRSSTASLPGGALIETSRTSVRLMQPVESDLERFRSLAAGTDLSSLRAACSMAAGSFLPGHGSSWAEATRAELDRLLRAALLEAATRLHEISSDQSLRYLRRLLDLDPFNEAAHVLCMRVLAGLERGAELAAHFEGIRATFGANDMPVSPHLVRTYRALASETTPDIGHPTDRLPMLGRTEELHEALAALDGTTPESVLVAGPAGIGKSRLVSAIAETLEGRGLATMWVDCGRGFGHEPFLAAINGSLTDSMIDHLQGSLALTHLGRLASGIPRLGGEKSFRQGPPGFMNESSVVLEGIAAVLEEMSGHQSIVVVFEDVHRASEGLAQTISRLATNARSPIRALCTVRTGLDHQAAIRRGPGLGKLKTIHLGPLDDFEIEQLVQLGLRGSVRSVREAIAHRSQGVPLAAVELIRWVRDRGLEGALDGPAGMDVIALAVIEQLEHLPRPTRLVLEACAVLGDASDGSHIRAMIDDAESRLDTLSDFELIERSGRRYRFRHSVVRDVVYEQTDDDLRCHLHRLASETLVAHGEHGLAVAAHLSRSGDEREAIAHLLGAGRSLVERGELIEAQEVFQHAAESARALSDHARVVAALSGLQEAQARAGNHAAQFRTCRELRALVTNQEMTPEPTHLLALADAAIAVGEIDLAIDVADSVCGGAAATDRDGTARAYFVLARALREAGRLDEAEDAARTSIDSASSAEVTSSGHRILGRVLLDRGDHAAAERELATALYFSEAAGDTYLSCTNQNALATALLVVGDTQRARAALEETVQRADRLGARNVATLALGNLGIVHFVEGRPTTAVDIMVSAAEAAETAALGINRATSLTNAAEVMIEYLGRNCEAEALLTEAEQTFVKAGHNMGRAQVLDCRGKLAVGQGDIVAARRHFDQADRLCTESGDDFVATQVLQSWALAESRLGSSDTALRLIDRAIALDGGGGFAHPLAIATRGWILFERGEAIAAMRELERAMNELTAATEHAHLITYWLYRVASSLGHRAIAVRALQRANAALRSIREDAGPAWPEIRSSISVYGEIEESWRRDVASTVVVDLRRIADSSSSVTVVLKVPPHRDAGQRRAALEDVLRQCGAQGGAATAADLGEILGVSRRTVQRDLASIRADGGAPSPVESPTD